MNKKNKIIIIFVISILFIIGVIAFFSFLFQNILIELGDNKGLDTKNYKTAVEVNSNANFILLFDQDDKVSNIIYLNDKSVEGLYHKKIEGKKLEKVIVLIVENLKNAKAFDDDTNTILIDYGNQSFFSKIEEELNKQFVIYGINKQITRESTTLKAKLQNLNLKVKNNKEKDLKTLYYHSLDIISKYQKNKESSMTDYEKEENIDEYALNIYNKLLTYSDSISNQSKDDLNGIDITTMNATGDYENELYATKKSWYYIKDYKVYTYINFYINGKNYDYCFLGSSEYTTTVCSE